MKSTYDYIPVTDLQKGMICVNLGYVSHVFRSADPTLIEVVFSPSFNSKCCQYFYPVSAKLMIK